MFRDPLYLLGALLGLLAVAGLAALAETRRRRLTALFGVAGTLARLAPAETRRRRRLKWALRAGAVVLLFVSLAGPQWGVELLPTQVKTRHVMIAVDTSLSMLTEDVHPSRMEKAREDLELLIDQLKGDRVGVIAFAGQAAVVCPVTTDLEAAKELLRTVSPGMIPTPGTAIGRAIRLAASTLGRYPGTKALVIVSDGEDHKTDPLGAADQAAAAGIKIFAVGVGTPDGGPIPLRDANGALQGYKKDRRGTTVISRLGESTLSGVAQRTGGAYYRAGAAGNEITDIADQIEQLEKTQGVGGRATGYENHFLLPLAAAFILLLVELLLPERAGAGGLLRRSAAAAAKLVGAALPAALLAAGLAAPARAASAESALRQGNKLYGKEQYAPALEQYALAGQRSPKDARPVFNAGDALFKLGQFDRAADAFSAVAQSRAPAAVRADAFYNLGNSRFSAQQYQEAVQAYRRTLMLDPGDLAARHNLAVALRFLKNPPPKSKPNPQDQKNQQNKQQDKSGQKKQNEGQNPDHGQPPPPKTRPQDQLSKEDAERILRAVGEKEKALNKQLQMRKNAPKDQNVEEDW